MTNHPPTTIQGKVDAVVERVLDLPGDDDSQLDLRARALALAAPPAPLWAPPSPASSDVVVVG